MSTSEKSKDERGKRKPFRPRDLVRIDSSYDWILPGIAMVIGSYKDLYPASAIEERDKHIYALEVKDHTVSWINEEALTPYIK